jgi:hypothetical protein
MAITSLVFGTFIVEYGGQIGGGLNLSSSFKG